MRGQWEGEGAVGKGFQEPLSTSHITQCMPDHVLPVQKSCDAAVLLLEAGAGKNGRALGEAVQNVARVRG